MIGQRLYQARLLSGMTQKEVVIRLAQLGYEVTSAVISKYELNKSTPPPSLMVALAQVFQVDTQYFFYKPQMQIEWVAYRKHSRLSKHHQEEIQGYCVDIANLQIELRRLLYPQDRVHFLKPQAIQTIDDAEILAEALRKEWGLGDLPIENLTHLAESKGIIIIKWIKNNIHFDGLSGWCEDSPVSVLNTATSIDRRRFSLAHEIAHLLMKTDHFTSDKASESFANRFAGAFLVPKDVVYHELGRKRNHIMLHELGSLKKRYGLSISAWIYRAKDLGVISDDLAQTLWQEMARLNWRHIELSQYDYIAHEEPTLLEQMCFRAVAEGLKLPQDIQQILPHITFEADAISQDEFPTPSQLLAMSEAERQKWMKLSFELAKDVEFEQFDAFGEEYF